MSAMALLLYFIVTKSECGSGRYTRKKIILIYREKKDN